MDRPIDIVEVGFRTDEIGNQIEDVVNNYHVFASINGGSGKESHGNATVNHQKEKTFKVRYAKALANLLTQKCQIVYEGKTFDVTDIDDFMERHQYLVFKGALRE